MNEKPKPAETEEQQKINDLIEELTVTDPDNSTLSLVLGGLMSGSCTPEQEVKNTRTLHLFLVAMRAVEVKHSISLKKWTERIERYLHVR